MAIPYVQSGSARAAATPSVTLNGVAADSTLIIGAYDYQDVSFSVTDTAGAPVLDTVFYNPTAGYYTSTLWSVRNCLPGTHTISMTGTGGTNALLIVFEIAASVVFDQAAYAVNAAGTFPVGPLYQDDSDETLLVSFVHGGSGPFYSLPAQWTNKYHISDGAYAQHAEMAMRVVSAKDAYIAEWTNGGSVNQGIIAAYVKTTTKGRGNSGASIAAPRMGRYPTGLVDTSHGMSHKLEVFLSVDKNRIVDLCTGLDAPRTYVTTGDSASPGVYGHDLYGPKFSEGVAVFRGGCFLPLANYPQLPTTGPATIMARLAAPRQSYNTPIGFGLTYGYTTDAFCFIDGYNDGTLYAALKSTNRIAIATDSLSHVFALTYDKVNMTAYRDGVQVGQIATGDVGVICEDGWLQPIGALVFASMKVGTYTWHSPGSAHWGAIWSRALSPAEIVAFGNRPYDVTVARRSSVTVPSTYAPAERLAFRAAPALRVRHQHKMLSPDPSSVNRASPLAHGLVFMTDGESVDNPIDLVTGAKALSTVGSRTQALPSTPLDDGKKRAYYGITWNCTQATFEQYTKRSSQYSYACLFKVIGVSELWNYGYANNSKLVISGAGVIQWDAQMVGGYAAVVGSVNVTFGKWQHIAVTYDKAYARLYLNGSLIGEVAETREPEWGYAANPLTVPSGYINGYVRYLAWWNRPLQAHEVRLCETLYAPRRDMVATTVVPSAYPGMTLRRG